MILETDERPDEILRIMVNESVLHYSTDTYSVYDGIRWRRRQEVEVQDIVYAEGLQL